MQYTILSSKPSIDHSTGKQFTDKYGNVSWSVFVKDDQGNQYDFLKRTKAQSPAPQEGQVINGELKLETNSATGRTWYRWIAEQQAPQQSSANGQQRSYGKSEEERREIRRMNLLSTALSRYSTTMPEAPTLDELINDALYLERFVIGEEIPPQKQPSGPLPTPSAEDIDMSTIPF